MRGTFDSNLRKFESKVPRIPMRTYRKRPAELRYCVHCHTPFESNHKRRIYCGNSCSTLAYYARKAQQAPTTGLGQPLALTPSPAVSSPANQPAVTLALTGQNVALLTASSLLADAIKHVGGKLFAPAPQQGPSTWLPAVLRTLHLPRVPLQHADWAEPLHFEPLPHEGELYYYRVEHEWLLWQDPTGSWHQLTSEQAFTQLTARLRVHKIVQQYMPDASLALPSHTALKQLKDLG
jgi:hypothetical protein